MSDINKDDIRSNPPVFKKSTFSDESVGCVDVALVAGGGALLRHSKDPGGAVIEYNAVEWAAFVLGVKAGEFG